jgi:hypothetical protein
MLNIFHEKQVKLEAFLENLDLYFFVRIRMINSAKALFTEFYLKNAVLD